MMEKHFQFNAKNYEPINWSVIFSDTLCVDPQTQKIALLANSHGLIMSSHLIEKRSECIVHHKNHSTLLNSDQLILISNDYMHNNKLYFYQINCFPKKVQFLQNNYLLILNKMINHACIVLTKMLTYTQEHLSNRHYQNCTLYNLETIRSNFADIIISQEVLTTSEPKTLDDVIFNLHIIIDSLKQLSILSGARAVLQDNVLHFLFHLKIFERFING